MPEIRTADDMLNLLKGKADGLMQTSSLDESVWIKQVVDVVLVKMLSVEAINIKTLKFGPHFIGQKIFTRFMDYVEANYGVCINNSNPLVPLFKKRNYVETTHYLVSPICTGV